MTLPSRLEGFLLHAGDARGNQKFRRRIKNRQEPLGDQVVKLLFCSLRCFGASEVGMMAK